VTENPEKHFIRNTAGITIPEFFWGFGLPVVVDSTFLQIFLKRAGASNFTIGLIPTMMFIGVSVFPLLADFFTSQTAYKRNAVIWLHIFSSLSIILFGILVLSVGEMINIVAVFLVCYSFLAIGIGLCLPVWLNYIVKIFSEEQNAKALSVMMIAQNIAKIIASLGIVVAVEKYAFDLEMSGLIFTLAGCAFLLGSFGFLLTVESPDVVQQQRESFFCHTVGSLKRVLSDKNFLMFLTNDLEFFAITGVMAFYALYATEFCGIAPSLAAGLFVVFHFIGSIVSNIIFGYYNFLSLKNKCLSSKLVTLVSFALLIFYPTLSGFLISSFFMGISRNMKVLVFPLAVKKISGLGDTTPYFAVSALITLPFSTGISLMNGKLLDYYAYLGANSYRLVFLLMALIVLFSLIFVSRVKMD
jgi:MFS family permease